MTWTEIGEVEVGGHSRMLDQPVEEYRLEQAAHKGSNAKDKKMIHRDIDYIRKLENARSAGRNPIQTSTFATPARPDECGDVAIARDSGSVSRLASG